jgi:dTDP-glucose 4,6-dehydratase
LEIARQCQVKKLLFLSSGAVYGKQKVPNVPETAPCDPVTVYGRAKLEAEKLCFASGIPATAARCFAFTGPYLDKNIHFAIGNFIRDALRGNEIIINGDGTPLRSYLYADDLVTWLFDLLDKGMDQTAYNVGSDQAISIAALARLVADTLAPGLPVKIMQTPVPGAVARPYVPDITLARKHGLNCGSTDLKTAIRLSADGC